jgi:hypothetical protein
VKFVPFRTFSQETVMGWSAGPAKQREWSERLERFGRSDLTVPAFCQQERISVASFYQWRRRIRAQSEEGAGVVTKDGSARATQAPTFVPLQIASRGAQQHAIRLRLPNGAQLWLPAGDASLLAAAIAAAGRLGSSSRGDEAC